MQEDFARLRRVLEETCRRGPVYYLPNAGNWGDGLIRAGTLRFLRDARIAFHEIAGVGRLRRWLPFLRSGTLIYGGGGAWCRSFATALDLVAHIHHLFERVVVLPSSYELVEPIPNVTFFCRDKYESRTNAPYAQFCHDMAFYLGPTTAPRGAGIGFFFRTDRERARAAPLPPDNDDLSTRGNHLSDSAPFFDAIARYAIVHTDRLHVAIAACLLGRELHLYPGSYFKNKAVYRSSIEARFANVHFHEP